jgi:DNA-directed RNA polymerase subunit omega
MAKTYSNEDALDKVGGRFKLTSLLEKRYRELLFGARPLVERTSRDPMDLLLGEVIEGKIELVPEAEAVAAAAAALMGETKKRSKAEAAAKIDLSVDDDEGDEDADADEVEEGDSELDGE